MGSYCDFRIFLDTDDIDMDVIGDYVTDRVLYALFYKRVKNKKPCVISIVGKSGEGKSTGALDLQRIFLSYENLRLIDYLDATNVTMPQTYFTKLQRLLNDPALKKVRYICVHEARTLVSSTTWQEFLTQAVSDVQALSRSIKPLIFMMISQDYTDTTKALRKTVDYFIEASRPDGKKTRLKIRKIWKDYKDIEKPISRSRRIQGYLVTKSGQHIKYMPKYLEVSLPDNDVFEKFDAMDTQAKHDLITKKMEKAMAKFNEEMGLSDKIGELVNFYKSKPESLEMVGKRTARGYNISKEFAELHNLNPAEVKQFKERLEKSFSVEEGAN